MFYVESTLDIVAGLTGEIIRGHTVDSQTNTTFTATAKVKKANPITDHDIEVFGQIYPRPWAGELQDRRWVGQVAPELNFAASLGSKRWSNGMLGDRNKFGSLAQKRWEGILQ